MTDKFSKTRRRILQAMGTTALLPSLATPGFLSAASNQPISGKVLVLVELAGGNDGLNTVIPTQDSTYYALRPNIGIARSELLNLDAETGLNPQMRGIADLWEGGDLQIVEGVGYPNPNRSHFRSIEIWNAGTGSETFDSTGWIADAFQSARPDAADADGLVIGGEMGPLQGAGRFSAMRDIDNFGDALDYVDQAKHPVRQKQSPLAHVLATYESAHLTGTNILSKLENTREKDWDFPYSELGWQLRNAARLLDAGVDVPVIKVVQGGYDTHAGQRGTHDYLLQELSEAVGAFATILKRMGRWDDVVVVTYSEFGRRAYENGSLGTDHGTAAPVIVTGGAVAGGLNGARPSLVNLDAGDLRFTTDYRQLYAGLLRDLWGLGDNPFAQQGFDGLGILNA